MYYNVTLRLHNLVLRHACTNQKENKRYANNILVLLLAHTLAAETAVNLVYPFHLLNNFIDLAVLAASHDVVDLFELLNTSRTAESVHFPLKGQESMQPIRFMVTVE